MEKKIVEQTPSKEKTADEKTTGKETSFVYGQILEESINLKALDQSTEKKDNFQHLPLEGKRKKESTEHVEVLQNHSWITNFYHNYTRVIAKANLHLDKASRDDTTPKNLFTDAGLENNLPKGLATHEKDSFPFNSILFTKAADKQTINLHTLKLDTEVYKALKKIMLATKGDSAITLGTTNHSLSPTKQILPLKSIPFAQLEKLGIATNDLLKKGMLDRLLKGEKTLPVHNLHIRNNKGELINFRATFQLAKNADGKIRIGIEYLPKQTLLPNTVKPVSHVSLDSITQKQHKESKLQRRESSWKSVQSMLIVDNLRDTLQGREYNQRKIPERLKGVDLNKQQVQKLREGKEVHLSGLISKDGTSFNATVKWDAEKSLLKFINAYPKQILNQEHSAKYQYVTPKTEVKKSDIPKAVDETKKTNKHHRSKGLRR